MTAWGIVALAYAVLSRLAYVVGVGAALWRQDRQQIFTREHGIEEGFRRFRRGASAVMNNDAVALVVVCLVTHDTLRPDLPRWVVIMAGAALVAIGAGIKVWARETLGAEAYYWHNFFDPGPMKPLRRPGPYRYLDNPMYTIGYLPAYGVALVFGSWPGLVAAGFAQAGILLFHMVVEKPHYQRLIKR